MKHTSEEIKYRLSDLGVQIGNIAIEYITELEKENAELKKQLEMSNKVYNDNLDYSHHIEGQLTKAKEIIRDLLSCLYSVEYDCTSDLKEAEQFLNIEVEK